LQGWEEIIPCGNLKKTNLNFRIFQSFHCSCDDQGCDDQAMLTLAEQLEAVEGAHSSPLNSSKSGQEGFLLKYFGSSLRSPQLFVDESLGERSQQKPRLHEIGFEVLYFAEFLVFFFCINEALNISAGCWVSFFSFVVT